VVFVFFSASGSKLPPYILPIFPALAALAARSLTPRVLGAQALMTLVAALAAALAIHRFAPGGPYAAYGQWLVVSASLIAVSAAAAWHLARPRQVPGAVLALSLGALGATQLGLAAHRTLAERFSVAATVAALAERPRADAPVFAVDVYDHTIPWNLRRTVTMVHYRDELGVAVDWEPAKFVPDLAAFAARWRAEREAWAFVPANAVERLSRELGIEMQVMARGPQYAIVKKP